jgi:hypothetical protein
MCSLVHGFERAVYEVNEGGVVGTAVLTVRFRTNVKGNTSEGQQQRAELALRGTLRAVPDGTAIYSNSYF